MAEETTANTQPPSEAPKAEPQQAKPARPRRRSLSTAAMAQQTPKAPESEIQTKATMLFDKYSYEVEVRDPSLKNYINIKPLAYPMSFRRGSQKSFSKANINIVERLCNSMMRGGTGGKVGGHVIRTKGRLQGKKVKSIKIIESAFETISRTTGKNPLQVFIYALEHSAPIEDTTRVIYGGIKSNVAVDISASRRLDIALRNVSMAAITSAFASKRSISDALANEIILAANVDINSYAIKRKNEIERMARSAK
jgi:small subunit ribosomal protein S7